MALLILGLVIFLGIHSIRIFANDWRTAQIARMGPNKWKMLFSVTALIGIVVIIWGYGIARAQPVWLWTPPRWAPHLAGLLTALAFILFPASHVRNGRIKAVVGHPMVLGVGLWALAHLLANGTLSAVVLFGAFLLWSVIDFAVSLRREPAAGLASANGKLMGDIIPSVVGLVLWALFAFVLHGWLIGVRPFS
ncbi:NnrU family protein [Glaciimonas soli]|uniref:NnrU family protein n=1 Tax=Glaciimonas soli TaxID=2590999 RepID=A0A843YMH0_9BURK|nr:NnrU family protein [Glaciimonas soli]MQR00655.1 NnrU family protein [Glaciimonas soli]